MKTVNRKQGPKRVGYKTILIMVIGAALLSNAMKDLNQLQDLADNLARLSSELLDAGVNTVSAKGISAGVASCKNLNSADELDLNPRMIVKAMEIDGDIRVNLPSGISREFKAERFNRSTSGAFPRRTSRIVKQRRIIDASANEGRELVLKTFNGSVSLRPVS